MTLNRSADELDGILERATKEIPLDRVDLLYLLQLTEESDIERLYSTARHMRSRYFMNKIFIYGFVYFSTYCRNNCAFCLYRKSNLSLDRYRKTDLEIMETAVSLVDTGVHLIDLTMGEDPYYFENKGTGFEHLIRTVELIKKGTDIPIMISAGVVPEDILKSFKEAGVDWYATYQETHNPRLFEKLRLDQSYDVRMERKKVARKMGFLIEEGLLTGVGDSDQDLINSIEAMKELGADQLRVMSFIPQKDTPMENNSSVPRSRELLIISIMRLVFPDRLIPASLDVDGLDGLSMRLNAGANVVTSIIPPQSGLAGVSNHTLDIEEGNRTVSKITPILELNGLSIASRKEYAEWVLHRQR